MLWTSPFDAFIPEYIKNNSYSQRPHAETCVKHKNTNIFQASSVEAEYRKKNSHFRQDTLEAVPPVYSVDSCWKTSLVELEYLKGERHLKKLALRSLASAYSKRKSPVDTVAPWHIVKNRSLNPSSTERDDLARRKKSAFSERANPVLEHFAIHTSFHGFRYALEPGRHILER